ncbi:4'-phosphopantetheinyl transferase superfamily protein [Lysobacter sp. F6437]|uniref:4'-phosphopantetheinyl transferase superfamily protein n=1 Tax=Lysobacter sp. F6437 TaxID=3459296 RepID=UPI00403DD723
MTLSAPAAMNPRWTWLPLDRSGSASAEPLVREWLGVQLGGPGAAVPIGRDPRGRPWLGGPLADWDCNWSHSGDGLLVALGQGIRVGADLEWRRPRPRALELARRFFHPDEADWLAAHGEQEHAFLRLWCAKEAVLKAHGHGLSFGLDRLVFADTAAGLRMQACDPALGSPSDWTVRELTPAPGYLGALAWRPRGAPAS